jgi:hypothetical protein
MAIKQTTNRFGKKEMSIEIDRLIELLQSHAKQGDRYVSLVTGNYGNYTMGTKQSETDDTLSVMITNEPQM